MDLHRQLPMNEQDEAPGAVTHSAIAHAENATRTGWRFQVKYITPLNFLRVETEASA